MNISLSDHFNYRKLLRFTFPSMVMMIFTSIYGVVDGFFVSNFVGKTPFAAVNLIIPYLMVLGAVGFMFGTGAAPLWPRPWAKATWSGQTNSSPCWSMSPLG